MRNTRRLSVHGLTVDRGGCFYYRIKQPFKALRDRGHWATWGSTIDAETYSQSNVLVAQLLNLADTKNKWTEWCERAEKLCVWEADDDIFEVHTQPSHGNAYDNPETIPRMIEMIKASHLVTTTTTELANVYRKYNPNVVVLPNYVPNFLLNIQGSDYQQKKSLILGYTGSPSHVEDFADWSYTFSRWMENHYHETIIRLYGSDKKPIGLPLTWRCETVGWQKMTEDYLRGLRMDVGVAPVLDTPFNRGKSGIKALEYAAIGVPSVVSDMQQYRDTVMHEATGFVCKTPRDWLNAYGTLWADPGTREAMGKAGKYLVHSRWLMSKNAWRWEQEYERAMERVGIK